MPESPSIKKRREASEPRHQEENNEDQLAKTAKLLAQDKSIMRKLIAKAANHDVEHSPKKTAPSSPAPVPKLKVDNVSKKANLDSEETSKGAAANSGKTAYAGRKPFSEEEIQALLKGVKEVCGLVAFFDVVAAVELIIMKCSTALARGR